MWLFFFNLVPSVHLLPKISFSWPNCLNAKVLSLLLLRLFSQVNLALGFLCLSHMEKFCVTLFLWKAGMPRVPATAALRTKQLSATLLPAIFLRMQQLHWNISQTYCKTWQKFPSNFHKHGWHQINLCKQDTEVLYEINAAQHSRVLLTEKDKCLIIAGLCGLHYWHYNLLCFGWGNQYIRREIKQKTNRSAIKLLKSQPQSLFEKKIKISQPTCSLERQTI